MLFDYLDKNRFLKFYKINLNNKYYFFKKLIQ